MDLHRSAERASTPSALTAVALVIGCLVLLLTVWTRQLELGVGVVVGGAIALAVREWLVRTRAR
jgi:hypothetical protein